MTAERVTGSFRDPSGYVFWRKDRLFRAIDAACAATLCDLSAAGLLERLVAEGQLVGTSFVDAPLAGDLAAEHPGFARFLEHERLEHITYPYEWSVSMLADAATLTLDLQTALLGAG